MWSLRQNIKKLLIDMGVSMGFFKITFVNITWVQDIRTFLVVLGIAVVNLLLWGLNELLLILNNIHNLMYIIMFWISFSTKPSFFHLMQPGTQGQMRWPETYTSFTGRCSCCTVLYFQMYSVCWVPLLYHLCLCRSSTVCMKGTKYKYMFFTL